jgi:hypothetical protein
MSAAVLLNTDNAQLFHLVKSRGKPSQLVRFTHLEEIRDLLRSRRGSFLLLFKPALVPCSFSFSFFASPK